MTVPPQGTPPRLFGLKITSNRIESALVMFTTLCLSGIFYVNDFIVTTRTILVIGALWSLYLWVIKKPERPY
tara:strand:+ start:7260 stop:7475 length:216 start_codon:yes stop_codon:yes gene_type:complete